MIVVLCFVVRIVVLMAQVMLTTSLPATAMPTTLATGAVNVMRVKIVTLRSVCMILCFYVEDAGDMMMTVNLTTMLLMSKIMILVMFG